MKYDFSKFLEVVKLENDIIEAIRSDKVVGENTCSVIDECYTDAEILDALEEEEIRSVQGALAKAHQIHQDWADRLSEEEALYQAEFGWVEEKPVAKKSKKRTPGAPKKAPKPKAATVNNKFKLVATCNYEDQPEKSMALLDMPAKGLKWYRQGQEVNHLVIHQINDGNIVLYKGGVENSVATMPVVNKKTLLSS